MASVWQQPLERVDARCLSRFVSPSTVNKSVDRVEIPHQNKQQGNYQNVRGAFSKTPAIVAE